MWPHVTKEKQKVSEFNEIFITIKNAFEGYKCLIMFCEK